MPTFTARRVAAVALGAAVASCSNASTSLATYVVAYEITASGGLLVDSVKYDDGHGTFIKVNGPSNGWLVTVSAATGGSVQASAWCRATGSGQAAKLKATWTQSGVSSFSDSSYTSASGPGAFTLAVSKHQL